MADPKLAGEIISHSLDWEHLGVHPDELAAVAGEMVVWGALLKLLTQFYE